MADEELEIAKEDLLLKQKELDDLQ